MNHDTVEPTQVSVTFGPGDAAVVVSVPSGYAPTVMRFDRADFGEGANVLDLMVACTLLEHALGQARSAYAEARHGAGAKPVYPQPYGVPGPGPF